MYCPLWTYVPGLFFSSPRTNFVSPVAGPRFAVEAKKSVNILINLLISKHIKGLHAMLEETVSIAVNNFEEMEVIPCIYVPH